MFSDLVALIGDNELGPRPQKGMILVRFHVVSEMFRRALRHLERSTPPALIPKGKQIFFLSNARDIYLSCHVFYT